MIRTRRITTIYSKEMLGILRDRRTLIAMIVVPLALYPLLMLGSVQALSSSVSKMQEQAILIGVTRESDIQRLYHLIPPDLAEFTLVTDTQPMHMANTEADSNGAISSQPAETTSPKTQPGTQTPAEEKYKPLQIRVRVIDRSLMEQTIRDRKIQAGILIPKITGQDKYAGNIEIILNYDPEWIPSAHAANTLQNLFGDVSSRIVESRMEAIGFPIKGLQPIMIEEVTIVSHGSILGQILPVILILMTITGAIYPAIDLTAGERERGTLETLMVCPVPVIDLIIGKFLAVSTVAIAGAALNLASISMTVYFGGFHSALSPGGEATGEFPLAMLPLILLLLIPLAVLCSAVMMAVCSYARSFKEAQNYVTPVILATLIPAGLAMLPTSELHGSMLVMPVANMVILTRELLLGSPVETHALATVIVSTSLYALAAVFVAAKVYGSETVVFTDSGSLKALFNREMIRPEKYPPSTMIALVIALLFPLWFFVQTGIQPAPSNMGAFGETLKQTGILMPLCLIGIPLLVLLYWKINPVTALGLRAPGLRFWVAGLLIGLGAWIPANELSVFQTKIFGQMQGLDQYNEVMGNALKSMPVPLLVLLIGVIPGICEEVLFRGFMLTGLSISGKKWSCIFWSACIFGIFHFMFFKFPVTAAMGIVLGFLCWQARSIWPCILAHVLHNSITALMATSEQFATWILGKDTVQAMADSAHLPQHLLITGSLFVVAGLFLSGFRRATA